jgi:hypothetical protein
VSVTSARFENALNGRGSKHTRFPAAAASVPDRGFPFPVMLLREKFVKPLNMLGFQALNPPTMWRIGENPCILPCKQRMSRETGSQQTACTASKSRPFHGFCGSHRNLRFFRALAGRSPGLRAQERLRLAAVGRQIVLVLRLPFWRYGFLSARGIGNHWIRLPMTREGASTEHGERRASFW